MNFTYILYSKSVNRYFIGATSDLEERIKKHNSKNKGFTQRASDWELKFKREFLTLKEAKDFELKIKSWKSRKAIEKLIQSQ